MKQLAILAAGMALTAVVAYGLEGRNGATATELFTADNVQSSAAYPVGFSGVPWSDFTTFHLGLGGSHSQEGEFAAHGSNIFVIGYAEDEDGYYTGLIRFDGSTFANLLQDHWEKALFSGQQIVGVTVPRVTAGALTAGHPLLVRGSGPEDGHYFMELWAVDPTVSPATEVRLHRWADPTTSSIQVAVDDDGVIYALNGGVLRKLVWNGANYDESTLSVPALDYGLVVGADGALYSLSADINWGGVKPPTEGSVLRIDPDTGASSIYATLDLKGGFFRGLAWDSDGNCWIALRDSRNGISYVIPLVAGSTIGNRSAGDRIAEASAGSLRNITAGTNGELYTLTSFNPDTVHGLEPGSGGGGGDTGGGGKGGGKGGGRGKKK